MADKLPKRTFTDLFNDQLPALHIKFDVKSTEESPITVIIQNKLYKQADPKGSTYINSICLHEKLKEFADFYQTYDGFELATPVEPRNAVKVPLLKQLAASTIKSYTEQYLPGGKFGWTIQHNAQSTIKSLYQGTDKWIVFAQIDDGPACLTTFLEGENAGNIFILMPEPRFNVLKPIAKGFNAFLDRIAKDPAAFLKLIRASVRINKDDGFRYGYVPIEYFDNVPQ